MTKFLICILLLFCISVKAYNYSGGVRSESLGNTSVTLSDVWSGFNNQAGLANLTKIEVGFAYKNSFLMKEISTGNLVIGIPIKGGSFAVTGSKFGFKSYSENRYGIAFGKKLGEHFSLGIQLNYLNTRIGENYGSKNSLVGEIGLLVKITEKLILGTHLFNPSNNKLSDFNKEKFPAVFKMGLNYCFSKKVYTLVEVEKQTLYQPVFKFGIEYAPTENIYLRGGINSNPSSFFFGAGFILKKIKLDLSNSIHPVLGYSPSASVGYIF